ncbi:gp15 domain protein [Mycobacteroides abscessus subsp. bolletii 1513]|uniref:Gp15 domain protein n=1 Tax=Mycobacteroides abscessus subsp. bolletii 1513 TaxID=1299321 RepID=X8DGH7_9MYCO|nr:gp15 domain protein [Mycobacteroides abscessus subsp. bolletii 1513]
MIRLEQQGNADQDALLRARNQVADAERSYVSAQMKLAEAQQGTWKKLEGATQGLADGMGQIGAALDKDFGISKGLPGLAENLTKFLANMAAARSLASSARSASSTRPRADTAPWASWPPRACLGRGTQVLPRTLPWRASGRWRCNRV